MAAADREQPAGGGARGTRRPRQQMGLAHPLERQACPAGWPRRAGRTLQGSLGDAVAALFKNIHFRQLF